LTTADTKVDAVAVVPCPTSLVEKTMLPIEPVPLEPLAVPFVVELASAGAVPFALMLL
jgi:hypothetical protein